MDGQNEIKEIDRLILKYLEGEASKMKRSRYTVGSNFRREIRHISKKHRNCGYRPKPYSHRKKIRKKHYGVSVLKSRTTIAAAKHSANHSTTLPSVQP